MSRKRKNFLKQRAMEMNLAKSRRVDELAEGQSTRDESAEGPSTSVFSDDILDLPAPVDSISSSDDEENPDDINYEEQLTKEEKSSIYKDWISEMNRNDMKKMAMMLYDNYVERFGLQKTPSAQEVALFFGVSDKTVRLWRKDFLRSGEDFLAESRGKYTRYHVVMDEEYRDLVLDWVRKHNYVSGQPNMVATDFCSWVTETLLPIVREHHPNVPQKISLSTGQRWLHKLGFQPSTTRKGVYIDGHERSDVVEYRKVYVRRLEVLAITHAPPPPCNDNLPVEPFIGPQHKPVILLFHDESTFHSNEDQGWMWGEKGKQPIKPKGQGKGIMVSDFVDEFNGLLALTDEEFRSGKV